MPVYAECGGLMYLARTLSWRGEKRKMVGIIDADAVMHDRPQGRGYTRLRETGDGPWSASGPDRREIAAHEFHYASEIETGADEPLLRAHDASGRDLGDHGLRRGSVTGAFLHLIDRA